MTLFAHWANSRLNKLVSILNAQTAAKFPVKDGIPLLLIDDAVLPEGVNNIEELKCFKK